MKPSGLVIAAMLVFVSACAPTPPGEPNSELDCRITTAMARWDVPGLAVVVVRGGESVLMKGYGYRSIGDSREIDADTHLQIASNSKMFTAYAIGMLVDEGRLSWDDPIKRYIPEFAIPDSAIAELVAIDDLLSHRSGLTGSPLGGFRNPDYTIKDLLSDLKDSELSGRFRARNHYSQAGMALLGAIVQRSSGLTWEQFVQTRIFEPLGMEASYTSNADFEHNIGNPEDVDETMKPAVKRDGVVERASWQNVGTGSLYAPAGGIISNMKDMSAWIAFRLNNGLMDGKQLISTDALHEIRAPRIPADLTSMNIPLSYFHPGAQLVDVGFGHYSFEHRGIRVITHNGGWMSSVVAIMPSEGLGVGIFSNAWFDEPAPWASLAFVNALALEIFDYFLGQRKTDWSNQMAGIVAVRGSGQAVSSGAGQ